MRNWRGARSPCVLLLAFIGFVCASVSAHAAFGFSIRLRVDPDRVPADGKSAVAVLAEVVDAAGVPAPDGTAVHFVTTLGEIASPVQTVGGLAQTVLTASNAAGTAVVSAVVGGVRQTVQVDFLAQPGSAARGSRLVELSADEVAYSAEKRVFVATWNAALRYQGMGIAADGIQYDMGSSVVCAQGNVVLHAGDATLKADALRYDLLLLRGRMVRLGDESERLVVEGSKLETRADTAQDEVLWEPLKTDDTRTWVKAQRAVVYPGEKIILDHATFYVNDTKVMSLRRHVLNPDQGSAVFGQAVAFSSASGVALDFPMYYRASAKHVGSLHIGRNRTLGGFQSDAGWSLGLREEYIREGRGEGAFELDDLLHPDRGLRWEHRQELGGGMSVNADASAMQFAHDGPRLRSSGVSFFRPVGSGSRASLNVTRSSFAGSNQVGSDLEYRLQSLRASNGVLVTPSVHLRTSSLHNEYQGFVVDPDTGEPLQTAPVSRSTTSPGVDASVSLPTKDLGRDLHLSAGMTTGWAWNMGGGSRGLLDGRVFLDRQFGSASSASLGFSYSSGSILDTSLFRSGRQLFTLSGRTTIAGTLTRLRISQDLAGERRFGTVFLSRPLPFGEDILGRPLWNFELSQVFSRFQTLSASNTKLALGRAIGRFQASLCYSPQGVGQLSGQPWLNALGYGYTYSGGRHVWLEFAPRQQ